MLRVVGLYDDRTARAVPPCASRRLRDEHEAAFCRTEIRQVEARVRTDDADRLHARQIMPLCHHLRAEQDIEVAPPKLRQDLRMCELSPRRIAIHAHNPCCGKNLPQLLLELFRA